MTPKKASPLLKSTGERYLPWLEEASIGYEHLHRYAYATQFVQNKRVLDLACGEGYGSYLLAKTAKSVAGIDIDNNTIKHARNKYIKQNLEFRVGSITEIPIDGERLFDVAICFEALEQIEDHQKLLSEVKRLLTPEGVFIVSTPNKTAHSDEPQFNNPFHVHEFNFDELRELFEKYFKNVKFLGQRIYCNSNIWPVFAGEDTKLVEYVVDKNPKGFVFAEDDEKIPLYYIAVASDAARDIEDRSSALVDVSNALLNQKDIQIAAHVRERERLAGEIGQLSAEVQGLRSALAEGQRLAAKLQLEKDTLERYAQKQQFRIVERQQFLVKERAAYFALAAEAHVAAEASRQELSERDDRIARLEAELDEKDDRMASLQVLIQQHEAILSQIYNSHGWKALTVYYHLRNKFLPEGTKRREIAKSCWNFLRKTSGFLPAENNGAVQSTRTLSVEPVVIKPVIEGDDVPKEEVTVSVVIPTNRGSKTPGGTSLARVEINVNYLGLIPPDELISEHSGGIDRGRFISMGDEILQHSLILPSHRILDLGCGCGKLARPLTTYLNSEGQYDGIDIGRAAINWCQEKYKYYQNFRFHFADLYSERYNPSGPTKSSKYKFPFQNDQFDVVFVGSVFTHMLPEDVDNYIGEIARVMKLGGVCLATWFLLDAASQKNVKAGLTTPSFAHEFKSQTCRVEDPEVPEAAVAYDEVFVRDLYNKHGLCVERIIHGEWGRRRLVPHWQDEVWSSSRSWFQSQEPFEES